MLITMNNRKTKTCTSKYVFILVQNIWLKFVVLIK